MDVKDYLPIYLNEAYSQLDEIEMHITLVKSGNATQEVYQNLRRCAHTIKGSSAIMGLNTISELSRNLEFTFKNLSNKILSCLKMCFSIYSKEVEFVKI